MKGKKKMSAKKKTGIILLAVLLLLAGSGVFVAFNIGRLLFLIQYSQDDGPAHIPGEEDLLEDDEKDGPADDSPSQVIDEADKPPLSHIAVPRDKNVMNILLVGIDSRKDNGIGRSDAMILMSVNKNTKQITMTSFLRDIYLCIEGRQNNRLNASYAFGGMPLLFDTIEKNFRIHVDKYIRVNFYEFVDVIDALGGVTVTVTDAELKYVNGGVCEINKLKGLPPGGGRLEGAGENLLLTGKQALSYARIRRVGNGDAQRTQRQRDILFQIFHTLKSKSITELYGILEEILPFVTTNLTKGELAGLLLSAPAFCQYPVGQLQIPMPGTSKGATIRRMSVKVLDFEANVKVLHETLYRK